MNLCGGHLACAHHGEESHHVGGGRGVEREGRADQGLSNEKFGGWLVWLVFFLARFVNSGFRYRNFLTRVVSTTFATNSALDPRKTGDRRDSRRVSQSRRSELARSASQYAFQLRRVSRKRVEAKTLGPTHRARATSERTCERATDCFRITDRVA